MNNRLKFYMYYDISDISLYAYTNEKIISKEFEKTRNMKRFYKKIKEGDFQDRQSLFRDYGDLELSMYLLKGKDLSLEIPITAREKFNITHMGYRSITIDISLSCEIFPFIFTDKVRQALAVLKYTEVYKFLNGQNNIPSLEELFSVDTLEIFLHEYGHTLQL